MKKILSLFLCLAVLLSCLSFVSCREAENKTEKTFTLVVTDNEQKETRQVIKTTQTYLGDALLDENIIEGTKGPYGLYIDTVNGLTADYTADGAWWAVYEGDEMSMNGISAIEIVDGATYKLIYTVE